MVQDQFFKHILRAFLWTFSSASALFKGEDRKYKQLHNTPNVA